MSATIVIRGDSSSAVDALGKVEKGLKDVDVAADRTGTVAGPSIARIAIGAGAALVSVEGLKRAFGIAARAVSEYVAENEEAQRQTEGFTRALDGMSDSFARMVIDVGESTGAIEGLTRAMEFAGAAFDAVAGRSASGIREGVAADLDTLRGSAEQAASRVADLQSEIDRIGSEYGEMTILQQIASDVTGDHADRVAALQSELAEARADLDAYTGAIGRSSQAQAEAAVSAIRYAARLAEFGGPNSEEAQRDTVGISRRQQQADREVEIERGKFDAIIELRAEVKEREWAESRAWLDEATAMAEREVEIERQKQAAISELRADVKAADAVRAAEEAADALATLQARQEDIAASAADAFGGLIASQEKAGVAAKRLAAEELKSMGISAYYESFIAVARGNVIKGAALFSAGSLALGAARKLGASVSESGGRGAGSPGQSVTNTTVTQNLVIPPGMSRTEADRMAAALYDATRRGLAAGAR